MRAQIASAVGMVIQVMRLSDGKRKLTHVTEIIGMEGNGGADAGHLHLQPHPHRRRRHGARRVPRHAACARAASTRCSAAASPTTCANFDPSKVLVTGMSYRPQHRLPDPDLRRGLHRRARRLFGLFSVARQKRKVNKRLKVAEKVDGVSALVMELRKQRGLTADGRRRPAAALAVGPDRRRRA